IPSVRPKANWMRIAQVAPLYESVPPRLYGGTERVVSYLTEELVRQGHHVTLFASGDSQTHAQLLACCPGSLRLDSGCVDSLAHHFLMLERVFRAANDFDFVHFHVDYLHFPLSRRSSLPHVTTLHGRLDLPDLVPLYREFDDEPVVSISYNQRKPLSWINWMGTVYHGLPLGQYALHEQSGQYLAFLGRISPEKRVDRAIEIATRAGVPFKIAAKVDKADRDYHDSVIRPLLDNPLVEFIGEIAEHEKDAFLGNALALLFPIDWPEPFGLAMIESMAYGTPVIAFPCGSVPEVVDPGVTGFIVNSVDDAVQAVHSIAQLDRAACRRCAERRFSAERMARKYLAIYQRLLAAKPAPARIAEPGPLPAPTLIPHNSETVPSQGDSWPTTASASKTNITFRPEPR
ncbi:MAG: glycosyltransferase family 4 protein, partial [Candidatus Acidiferrales bacterium]